MQKPEENALMSVAAENTDSNTTGKVWETPRLKVLPVPTRTQGGTVVNAPKADDVFYKKS